MVDVAARRREMVDRQIAARGVRSEAVLRAMKKVQRELFLPEEMREFAYEDSPLGIAAGQTISQPYIVALMTEALDLKPGEKVLEIGTGSGYAAAVLGEIATQVYTVERIDELARPRWVVGIPRECAYHAWKRSTPSRVSSPASSRASTWQ